MALESAAVVETKDFGWSCSHSERLLAADSQQWVQCGALTTGLCSEEALRLRDRLELAPSTAMDNDSAVLRTLMERFGRHRPREQLTPRTSTSQTATRATNIPFLDLCTAHARCRTTAFTHPVRSRATWLENEARRHRARQWARPGHETEEGKLLRREWARERRRRKKRREEPIRAERRAHEEEWAKEAEPSWEEWKAKEENSWDITGGNGADSQSPRTKVWWKRTTRLHAMKPK